MVGYGRVTQLMTQDWDRGVAMLLRTQDYRRGRHPGNIKCKASRDKLNELPLVFTPRF